MYNASLLNSHTTNSVSNKDQSVEVSGRITAVYSESHEPQKYTAYINVVCRNLTVVGNIVITGIEVMVQQI
jgi:hypothetical protein